MKYGRRARAVPPEWSRTILLAGRLHCPPWELDPDPCATRYVWGERMACVMEAEAEVARWQQSQAKAGRR